APPDRPPLGDGARAVAEWAAASLRVPAGHPAAGRPFNLDPWQIAIVDDALTHRETLACMARKNAKSATIAVLVLAHLAGPLRRPGWRCGVLSVNRGKAGELLRQIEEIRDASRLGGLTVRRTPWPGRMVADDTAATVEIEGAGYASGHASGYDLAIVDELGLLAERHRPMVAGMRSSVSAKGGRFVALTIHGPGPFVPEILNRRGAPGLAVHHYEGDPDLALDDPENWAKGNPGLGTIKSVDYMRSEAARVLDTPSDQALFRAADLNLPGSPVGELVCSVEAWRGCVAAPDELPPRTGRAFVGIDLGATKSFTSAATYWPATGRLEVLTACPDTPGLAARARADAAGSLYERAHRDGVLLVLSGRLTPVGPFLARLRAHLAGAAVGAVGCDRERHPELLHHMADQGLGWHPVWRGAGARAAEDAANDIRAFQRSVEGGRLRTPSNVLMVAAIGQSHLVRDADGNASRLRQSRARARIDSLQASVIAVGLGEAAMLRRRSRAGRVYVA
ncbi:MAG: terminase large subunit, partial [Acidobacteria bacterium]|nr:terminase large subunit [Acidobacteriota bacterium]